MSDPIASPDPQAPTAAPVEIKTFTQEQVDAIIKDRLDRHEKKAAAAREAAERAAAEKALAEQGEYRTLAEQRQAEIDALKAQSKDADALAKERDRYAGALKAQLTAARADVPEHVLTILDKLDPVDQLEWLAANREHFRRGDGVGSPQPGTKRPATADIPAPKVSF